MAIERRTDGGWYRDGERLSFQRRGIFWDGCGSNPVLKLAREVVDHSQKLGWALVVFGANVTQQRSLGLDDEQRPARANPHPAAVERRSSRSYCVEFTTGDVAVIRITEQCYWGAEDADVETTVTIAAGTVPQPTEAQINAHQVAPIVVSEAEARRAVPDVANGHPVLRIPGYDTIVEWMDGRVCCHTTNVSATPEAEAVLEELFGETMQRARELSAPYQHVEGGFWELPREVRETLRASGIPDGFFVQCLSRY
jgi:hypothetical protein